MPKRTGRRKLIRIEWLGTSLVVQWLKLCTPNAGSPGLISGQETRSQIPQLRVLMPPGWRGMWEGGSGWGTHVNPWLIHINVWQKPLQYCKVISLQLIKINGKKI